MSVITPYTAPLPYQNLALYHPMGGWCVTPQQRTQAKRCWKERRTCSCQAHLGRSKSVGRESSYDWLDLADKASLPLDPHFHREKPKVKQAGPSPDGNHPEIPWAWLCTTCEEIHPCSLSRVIWDHRWCQNWTLAMFRCVNWLRVCSRELWGPF